MNRFFSLLKICQKNSFEFLGINNRQKRPQTQAQKAGRYLLLALSFLYFGWIFFSMGRGISLAGKASGNLPIVIGFLNLEALLFTVLICFIAVPTMLFFARDIEAYLSMPFRPGEIFLAKLGSAYIYLLSIFALIGVPAGAGYLSVEFSLSGLLGWIFSCLLLPLWLVSLMALVFLVLFQVLPFLRNKDHFNLIGGIIGVGGAILLYILLRSFPSAFSQGSARGPLPLFAMKTGIDKAALLFPTLKGSIRMIAGGWTGLFQGLGFSLAASVAFFILLFFLAQGLYFRVVLSMSGSSEKEKKISKSDRLQILKKGKSPLKALIQWEFRLLFRTSAYFMNVVFASFLSPLWMLFIMGFPLMQNWNRIQAQGLGWEELNLLAREFIQDQGNPVVMGILVGAGLGAFALMGSATATAVSRDAQQIESFKSLPIRARDLYLAEFLPSYLISALPLTLIGLVFLGLIQFWLPFSIPLLLSFFLTSLAIGLLEFRLDVRSPNLDWTEEIVAVKQNKNSMISVGLLTLLIIGFVFVFVTGINKGPLALGIFLIDLALLSFTAYDIFVRGEKYLSSYNRF